MDGIAESLRILKLTRGRDCTEKNEPPGRHGSDVEKLGTLKTSFSLQFFEATSYIYLQATGLFTTCKVSP